MDDTLAMVLAGAGLGTLIAVGVTVGMLLRGRRRPGPVPALAELDEVSVLKEQVQLHLQHVRHRHV